MMRKSDTERILKIEWKRSSLLSLWCVYFNVFQNIHYFFASTFSKHLFLAPNIELPQNSYTDRKIAFNLFFLTDPSNCTRGSLYHLKSRYHYKKVTFISQCKYPSVRKHLRRCQVILQKFNKLSHYKLQFIESTHTQLRCDYQNCKLSVIKHMAN